MAKKVRRVEIEKVKNGNKGHLHKVTTHYHDSPGKAGKGFGGLSSKYEPPEETYHNTGAAAHKQVKKMLGQMTATPDETPSGDNYGSGTDDGEEPDQDDMPGSVQEKAPAKAYKGY